MGVLQDVMRDRSLPGKVEFGQNSEFIPCLVLVLFGQKCTPIAKILLLMKRSAVSGCAYLVPHKRKHLCQNELQPVSFIAPSFCFLLPTFSPFFKYDPCHFLWVYRAKTYFCKCTTTLRHFSLQFWLGQGKSDSECNVDLCSVKHG